MLTRLTATVRMVLLQLVCASLLCLVAVSETAFKPCLYHRGDKHGLHQGGLGNTVGCLNGQLPSVLNIQPSQGMCL